MTEAKGSDVRAACEAAARSILALSVISPENYTRQIERHLAPVIETRVQAASVEMRERCATIAEPVDDVLSGVIRKVSILTNAYDTALLRKESDTIMRFRKMLNRLGIHGYYNEMQKEFGDGDALTQPAPEAK